MSSFGAAWRLPRGETSERGLPGLVVITVLAVGLVVSLISAVSLGAVDLPMRGIWQALTTDSEHWQMQETILVQVRIPRVLTAALVGAGLALAGAVLQRTLRNPLAEPYLLGISSGASLGAVSVILLGVALFLPLAAFAGGILALAATLGLGSGPAGMTTERVILAGVAVTAFFSALTSLVIFRSPDSDGYRQVLHWLLGSLASSTWQTVTIAGITVLIFGGLLLASARLLGLFHLSDAEIEALGINTRRARGTVLVFAALLAAGMVSVSGAIGFVGLIVPHVAGALVKGSETKRLIASLLIGALLLIWADTFSRTVLLPEELPVGITTAILGATAFAVIMIRRRRVSL
ncbi:FecCD family ABC transporter permease [Nesterenkonia muleiensis]|uniref:FecCD family ABC transporter permease n=1 Tax=Nesterenkonia muleiensis TaxID=2282648 RepID=UPI000E7565FC|nr:iron chelate uptake ABC transporter family permease subunit [Nesterenkonia muleiensis]